jgi:hypothetical protein
MNYDDRRRPDRNKPTERPWPPSAGLASSPADDDLVERISRPDPDAPILPVLYPKLSRADTQWERLGRMLGKGMATALVLLLGFILVVAALGVVAPVLRWALRRWGIEW